MLSPKKIIIVNLQHSVNFCCTVKWPSYTHITYVYIHSFFFLSFSFLGPHPQHMEVPRLRVESELTYTTATAMPDLSHVCELHHSSWQCWILNPLSEARDRTYILMDPGRIWFYHTTMGTPFFHIIFHHVSSQVTGYSFPCYTAGSHCLSVPNAIVCIYYPKLLVHPTPSNLLHFWRIILMIFRVNIYNIAE